MIMNNYEIIDEEDYNKLQKKKLDFIEKFVIISIGLLIFLSTIIYFFGYNLLKGFIAV